MAESRRERGGGREKRRGEERRGEERGLHLPVMLKIKPAERLRSVQRSRHSSRAQLHCIGSVWLSERMHAADMPSTALYVFSAEA